MTSQKWNTIEYENKWLKLENESLRVEVKYLKMWRAFWVVAAFFMALWGR